MVQDGIQTELSGVCGHLPHVASSQPPPFPRHRHKAQLPKPPPVQHRPNRPINNRTETLPIKNVNHRLRSQPRAMQALPQNLNTRTGGQGRGALPQLQPRGLSPHPASKGQPIIAFPSQIPLRSQAFKKNLLSPGVSSWPGAAELPRTLFISKVTPGQPGQRPEGTWQPQSPPAGLFPLQPTRERPQNPLENTHTALTLPHTTSLPRCAHCLAATPSRAPQIHRLLPKAAPRGLQGHGREMQQKGGRKGAGGESPFWQKGKKKQPKQPGDRGVPLHTSTLHGKAAQAPTLSCK